MKLVIENMSLVLALSIIASLLLATCVAHPLDILQSANANDVNTLSYRAELDASTAETSNISVLANAEPNETSIIADAEYAETSNSPALAEKTDLTDDLNLHSQAEDNGAGAKSGFRISLLQAPVKTRESVNLESEAVPSKVLSLYDNSQKLLLDNKQFLPIVDTISEHEKYGNNGDMFDGISRSIVNGYEAFSNILNAIIQKPQQIFRSINKSVNVHLDVLGGKLVGLN